MKHPDNYEQYLEQLANMYDRLIDRDIQHMIDKDEQNAKHQIKMVLIQHNQPTQKKENK